MIDSVLYNHIRTNITYTGSFVYGSAEQRTAPYIIMYKVSDAERPVTNCDIQGEVGEAVFQFSAYTGENAIKTVEFLQAFKEQVKTIIGVIGTTEQYRIDSNYAEGVKILSDGSNSLNVWGAFFDTTIRWVKL